MSSANSPTPITISSLSSKRHSFFFPSHFSPSQTPFSTKRLFSSRSPLVTQASSTSEKDKKQVLIINTDSGGHAVIGFYFAGELLADGHNVTILTAGDEGSDKMKKPPFTRFSELVSAGARTVWGDVVGVGEGAFDVVLDNNGKDLEAVK